MESLKLYEDRSYTELVEDIHFKLKQLEKNQLYILTEQERSSYKMMNVEELIKLMLDNQIEMSKSINKIMERLD